MGISGLLPLLKEIQVNGHIKEFAGKRLAVDAYVWLHKGAFGCAEELVKRKKTTRFVDYAMYRVRLLRHHGITPFIVFDGGPLPAKKGTEVTRAKSRAENLARASSLEAQGRAKEARDYYTKCVDITPEMAYQLIKALRAEGIDYVVAPYEADAQLYYLEREGYVDGIITEDSDLLVFGCKQVIFKLDNDGNCVSIHRDRLATISQFPMHGWTNTQFRRMAMLSGCDYLPSIPGIGLKTAHRLLRRYKTVEKVLTIMRLEGAHKIPEDYITAFNQAELAFMHQRVFCLEKKRLIPLNEFPEAGLGEEDQRWIGLDVDVDIARGMALGDIHPETRVGIVDEWPDYRPVQRTAGKQVMNGVLAESSKDNIKSGPMDAFVSRKKVVLPRPVGTNCSGTTRLSDLTQTPNLPNRPRSLDCAIGSQRSKFFGGTTRGSKGIAKWPSGEGIALAEKEPELVWEKSDEAGPEVNIDSPVRQHEGRGRVMSSPMRLQSPIATSSRIVELGFSSPLPTRKGSRSGSPKLVDTPEVESPHGPDLSSPLAEGPPDDIFSSSPVKPYILSSPPDVGRERSTTADPFSPSPSPKQTVLLPRKDLNQITDTQHHLPCQSSLRAGQRSSWPSIDTPNLSQTPTRRSTKGSKPISHLVLIPTSSSPIIPTPRADSGDIRSGERLKRAKLELGVELGSSDSVQEDDLVTPSFDMTRSNRLQGKKRQNSGIKQEKGEMCEEEGEGEDVILVEEEEEDLVLKEEGRRAERAKVVAMGWRDKFALKGHAVGGGVTSDNFSPNGLKRRRTDPTPTSLMVVPSYSIPPARSQPAPLPAQSTDSARVEPYTGRAAHITPRPVLGGRRQTNTASMTTTTTIQISKQKKAMPLSACAPRILNMRDINTSLKSEELTPILGKPGGAKSGMAVKRKKGWDENAERYDGAGRTEKVIGSGGGNGGTSGGGLSRFLFSGEVVRTREVL